MNADMTDVVDEVVDEVVLVYSSWPPALTSESEVMHSGQE